MPYKSDEDRRACQRRYYERNKSKVIKANALQKKKKKLAWNEFKKTLSCVKCGVSHPAVIDFHHVNPEEKEYNIHELSRIGATNKIKKELEKCVIYCANCHRIHHYEEREK